MMQRSDQSSKQTRVRILKFCASRPFELSRIIGADGDRVELKRGGANLRVSASRQFQPLVNEGLVASDGSRWKITRAGKSHLRRLLSLVDEFQNQHRLPGTREIIENGVLSHHKTNESESPLGRLHHRKGRDGNRYIDDQEFQAGERLRADYFKGQLTQRLTSNWNTDEGGRSGYRNGIGDLTDTALGARTRTENALVAVGPELAGVLVDICCFLKGLERVERERQWPPRSAKLMLKTGLSILARHYGCSARGKNHAPLRHWGDGEYRPHLVSPESTGEPPC